jgi:hypothetical protein
MGNNMGNIFYKYTPRMYEELVGYCRTGDLGSAMDHYRKHKWVIRRLRRSSLEETRNNNRIPNNSYYNYALMEAACEGKHINIIMWLHDYNIVNMSRIYNKIYHTAVMNYDLDIMSYLEYKYGKMVNKGKIYTNEVFVIKCLEGDLRLVRDIFRYSQDKDKIYEELQCTFNAVCQKGHLNVAKFLYKISKLPDCVSINWEEQKRYSVVDLI